MCSTSPFVLDCSDSADESWQRVRTGRGLHSSTFQLILSRFWHKLHPNHPLTTPTIPYVYTLHNP